MAYLDIRKILSYNCPLNFINGARSSGKTFSTLDYALESVLKNPNSKFVYLRRYETEMKDNRTLFNSVLRESRDKSGELKWAGYIVGYRGRNFYASKEEDLKKESDLYKDTNIIGKAVQLSTSTKLKSTDFSDYDKIIFEEYAVSGQFTHYLSDEVTIFLELLSTVFRRRKIRVYFLGNNLKSVNPYYLYFGVRINPKYEIQRIKLNGKKQILVWNFRDREFEEETLKTDIGMLTKGTTYGNYAILNESLHDNTSFVRERPKYANDYMNIRYNDHVIGLWLCPGDGIMWAGLKPCKQCPTFAVTTNDHDINLLILKNLKNTRWFRSVRDAYTFSYLYYQNITVKEIMAEVLKMMSIA